MYTSIIFTAHIDAPVCEKPRLFSHWKPSLAQVATDFTGHGPATLRVLHKVVQSANIRAEARLQASQSTTSSLISPRTSPFPDRY